MIKSYLKVAILVSAVGILMFGATFVKAAPNITFLSPNPMAASSISPLTINGSGFTSTSEVSFFGSAYIPSLANGDYTITPQQITVYPSFLSKLNAGSYNVTVATGAAETSNMVLFTITKASPTISTTMNYRTSTFPFLTTLVSPGSIPLGGVVYDSSFLSGGAPGVSGFIEYKVYSDSTCTLLYKSGGTKLFSGSAGVTGGTMPNSDDVIFDVASTYYWQAKYLGDLNNNPATSPCTSEVLTVASSTTTTKIKIVKKAVSSLSSVNGAPFYFTMTGPNGFLFPTIFITVDQNGDGSYTLPNTAYPNTLQPGTYSITENIAANLSFKFTSVSCTIGTTPTGVFNGISGITGLSVADGQTTICTFTDTKLGTLQIEKKTVDPYAGPAVPFEYTINPGDKKVTVNLSSSVGRSSPPTPLLAGTYSIDETTIPPGWAFNPPVTCLTAITGTPVAVTSTTSGVSGVTIKDGQDVVCTFTNKYSSTATGELVIIKKTIGGNDGTFVFDISPGLNQRILTTQGGSSPLPPAPISLIAGTYSIFESVPFDWKLDSVVCSNGINTIANPVMGITIAAGQTVTCTFTNSKTTLTTGTLQIVKNTTGGNGTFNYTVQGPQGPIPVPGITTVGAAGFGTGSLPQPLTVSQGTYTITEEVPPGWTFNSVYCGGDIIVTTAPSISVFVGSGAAVVCTFSNAKTTSTTGTLQIVKNTTGGDGTFNYNVQGPTTWTPSITTGTVTLGTGNVSKVVNPGTSYAITEASQSSWTFNSVSCYIPGGAGQVGTPGTNGVTGVPVYAGLTTTCTFSNIKSSSTQGTLQIVKNTTGGDGTFNYTVTGPTAFTTSITTSITNEYSKVVNSGTSYAITETIPSDWTPISVSCYLPGTGTVGTPTTDKKGITNIRIDSTLTTTCTFANSKTSTAQTTLQIVKNTTGGVDGTFNYTASNPSQLVTPTSSTSTSCFSSPPINPVTTSSGTGLSLTQLDPSQDYYCDITETLPDSSWILDSATCDTTSSPKTDIDGKLIGVSSVFIPQGQTVTCTFNNSGGTESSPPPQPPYSDSNGIIPGEGFDSGRLPLREGSQ